MPERHGSPQCRASQVLMNRYFSAENRRHYVARICHTVNCRSAPVTGFFLPRPNTIARRRLSGKFWSWLYLKVGLQDCKKLSLLEANSRNARLNSSSMPAPLGT